MYLYDPENAHYLTEILVLIHNLEHFIKGVQNAIGTP